MNADKKAPGRIDCAIETARIISRSGANKMRKWINVTGCFVRNPGRPAKASRYATLAWIVALLGLALWQTVPAKADDQITFGIDWLRRGRIRRLLPGAGHRHLRQTRPRGDHSRGRSAGQSNATDDGGPAGLQSRWRPRHRVRAKPSAVRRDRGDLSEGPGRPDRPSRPGQRQLRRPQRQADRGRGRRAAQLVSLPVRQIRLQRVANQNSTPSTWRRSWPTRP